MQQQIRPIKRLKADQRDGARDYLFDMIGQMARLARRAGELDVAIHLEAIIAARRAASADRLI